MNSTADLTLACKHEPDKPELRQMDKKQKLRLLNDRLRSSLEGGRLVITAGVRDLSEQLRSEAIQHMRNFDQFNADNDPNEEHDFGSFEINGRTFFFELEYYDRRMNYASDDPSDPSKTTRILTLGLLDDGE